jgi:hypothetical protein
MRRKIFVFALTILLIFNVSVVPSSASTGVAVLDNIAAMIASLAVTSGVMYINLTEDLDNFDSYLDNMPSSLSDVLEAEALENDNELTLTAQQYADFATYFRTTYDLDNMGINEVYSVTSYPTIPVEVDGVISNIQIRNDTMNSSNHIKTDYFTNTYLTNLMENRYYDLFEINGSKYAFAYEDFINMYTVLNIRNDLTDYSSELCDTGDDVFLVMRPGYTEAEYLIENYIQHELEFNVIIYEDNGVHAKVQTILKLLMADDSSYVNIDLSSFIGTGTIYTVPALGTLNTYLPSGNDPSIYNMDLELYLGGVDSLGNVITGTMPELEDILGEIYTGEGEPYIAPVYKNTLPYDYTGETEVTLPYVPGAVGTYEGVTSTELATEGLDIPLQSGLSSSLDISSRYGISFLQNAFERLYVLRNADSVTPIKVTFDMRGIWNSLGNLRSFNVPYPFDSDDLTLIDLKYLDQWMFLGVSVRSYLRMIIASAMYISTGLWLISRVRKAA